MEETTPKGLREAVKRLQQENKELKAQLQQQPTREPQPPRSQERAATPEAPEPIEHTAVVSDGYGDEEPPPRGGTPSLSPDVIEAMKRTQGHVQTPPLGKMKNFYAAQSAGSYDEALERLSDAGLVVNTTNAVKRPR